jgi:hypothetical protein
VFKPIRSSQQDIFYLSESNERRGDENHSLMHFIVILIKVEEGKHTCIGLHEAKERAFKKRLV